MTTFADDSYRLEGGRYSALVTAAIAPWSDLRWLEALREKLGRPDIEIKGGLVFKKWSDLSADLRRSIRATIRDAVISISDPGFYRAEIEVTLERLVKKRIEDLSDHLRREAARITDDYVQKVVLLRSPAYDILDPTTDDDFPEEAGPDLEPLRRRLANTHNVRFFAARSALVFRGIYDDEYREKLVGQVEMPRFLTPEQIRATRLLGGIAEPHVFDKGNTSSVDAIGDLSAIAVRRVRDANLLLVTPGGRPTEGSSKVRPELQAADVAAYHARSLYDGHGLKAVCDEFRCVIHNSAIVRDWRQSEAGRPPRGMA